MHVFSPPHHFDDLGVGLLCQVAPADGHVVHQLVECGALVLLHLEVRQRVHKVKDSTALLQLLQEQLRLLRRWHVWTQRKRHRGREDEEKRQLNWCRNKCEPHRQTVLTPTEVRNQTAQNQRLGIKTVEVKMETR